MKPIEWVEKETLKPPVVGGQSQKITTDWTFRQYWLIPGDRWILLHFADPFVFTEVAQSEVIRDLTEHGIPIPSELKRVGRGVQEKRESDRQIVETLQAVGHRLTTTQLLAEMSKRRLNPSESTIKKRLAELVKDKRLTNDPRARPRGYGLPE